MSKRWTKVGLWGSLAVHLGCTGVLGIDGEYYPVEPYTGNPSCGNGRVEAEEGEQCDDGNRNDGDACSKACQEQKVLSLALGEDFSCALLSGGVVKCWGANWGGQLGLGDKKNRGDDPDEMGASLPAVDLGTGAKAIGISVGSHHACALLEGGAVKCWGYGPLGQGDNEGRGDEPYDMGDELKAIDLNNVQVTALASGASHVCALLATAEVKCWGYGDSGQLGAGMLVYWGDEPGEMATLPPVNLGTGLKAGAMTAGNNHTCALLTTGVAKCWGMNSNGQIGLGSWESWGDEPNEMGNALPTVPLGMGYLVDSIVAGNNATCAILADGTTKVLKCWGNFPRNPLGEPEYVYWGDEPGEMGDQLPVIDLGFSGAIPQAVAMGYQHICVLRTDGRVQCWGDNYFEQTGGTQPVELGSGLSASAIAADGHHTCAIVNDRVKCWGANESGQLGYGDTFERGDHPAEMGNGLPFVKLFNDAW